MEVSQVLNCMFSSWYPKFQAVTFKSHIINVPKDVEEYLLADGLVLPEGCEEVINRDGWEEGSDAAWSDEEEEEATTARLSFPEFQTQIEDAISSLGGAVFPKLNWSAPRDASWVTFGNTLKCTCARDIFLLLKSSDFITHDLTRPFDCCKNAESLIERPGFCLALRRWYNINPGHEFRCFVHNNTLTAISQRDHNSFYEFISPHKDEIKSDITEFYKDNIHGQFPDSSYVFDVYRQNTQKIYIVDFNPYGRVTDPLLFTWDELYAKISVDEVEFRSTERSVGMTPFPYRSYSMPQDFVHLSSGLDPHKLSDFLQLKKVQEDESSDEGEEEQVGHR